MPEHRPVPTLSRTLLSIVNYDATGSTQPRAAVGAYIVYIGASVPFDQLRSYLMVHMQKCTKYNQTITLMHTCTCTAAHMT